MARSDATRFVVEVLEGPNSGAVAELSGRELPYRSGAGGSISYGRSQRTKLTWYPGNPVATQQIVGPVLAPTTINGIWKERYLGENKPIDLVELFEELLVTGVQVRVSWQTIVRKGIVKDLTWAPGDPTGGLSDVKWEIAFEWNSAGETPRRIVGDVGEPSMRDGCVLAADAIGDLIQLIEDLIEEGDSFVGLSRVTFRPTKIALEDDVEELDVPLRTIATSAAQMGDEPNLPARLLEDASSAMARAQTTAGDSSDLVANIFPAIVETDDSLSSILGRAIQRYDVVDAAFAALVQLFKQRSRLESIVRPSEFAKIPALVGGDLREVALQFYGNADLWTRIAEANGIETSEIPGDADEIVVPLSLPDSLDLRKGA